MHGVVELRNVDLQANRRKYHENEETYLVLFLYISNKRGDECAVEGLVHQEGSLRLSVVRLSAP